jgi:hypothetical protein
MLSIRRLSIRRHTAPAADCSGRAPGGSLLPAGPGQRSRQAHCHLGLGTLYATTGQRAQAQAALSTATEKYRAMDMTLWLPQAEATLVQLGKVETPAA